MGSRISSGRSILFALSTVSQFLASQPFPVSLISENRAGECGLRRRSVSWQRFCVFQFLTASMELISQMRFLSWSIIVFSCWFFCLSFCDKNNKRNCFKQPYLLHAIHATNRLWLYSSVMWWLDHLIKSKSNLSSLNLYFNLDFLLTIWAILLHLSIKILDVY